MNTTALRTVIDKYIQLIKTKSETDEMKFLKKYHPNDYEKKMGEYVPTFKEEYPFLFRMILSGADLSMLDVFLTNMNEIEQGNKTLNEARNDLGHILHGKYVKDKV